MADLYAGALSSNPGGLQLGGASGPLLFMAEDAAHGRELWRLSTPLGAPELLAELAPGERSSVVGATAVQGDSWIAAADVGAGFALWKVSGVGGDGVAPSLTCPLDRVEYAGAAAAVAVTYPAPTVADTADPAPRVTASRASGSQFPVGLTSVTVTATDFSNNVARCSFRVDVRAGSPPPPDPGPGSPDAGPDPGPEPSPPSGSDGGCSSSSGGALRGGALLLVALAAGLGRRRRSRR